MNDPAQHRIQVKKPDLEELTRHHTVVDMHFHTRHSDGHEAHLHVRIKCGPQERRCKNSKKA